VAAMELRLFVEPQQGASYADQLAIALKAEECGFPGIFRSDHLLVMGDGDGLPGHGHVDDAGGLARDTTRIRLGHPGDIGNVPPPRASGRCKWPKSDQCQGTGRAWARRGLSQQEHAAYGIPFPTSVIERFDRLESSWPSSRDCGRPLR